jgi:hypothetical protein
MEMMILAILSPALHCDWQLTGFQEALITTVCSQINIWVLTCCFFFNFLAVYEYCLHANAIACMNTSSSSSFAACMNTILMLVHVWIFRLYSAEWCLVRVCGEVYVTSTVEKQWVVFSSLFFHRSDRWCLSANAKFRNSTHIDWWLKMSPLKGLRPEDLWNFVNLLFCFYWLFPTPFFLIFIHTLQGFFSMIINVHDWCFFYVYFMSV